jgi:para-nitrobenzyl esterase
MTSFESASRFVSPSASGDSRSKGKFRIKRGRDQKLISVEQGAVIMTKNVQDKGKPTIIQTDKGKVRCSQFDTHLEAVGIPYAAPPMGDLRFRAPIEHAAWTDVRDATQFASASLQAKTQYDRAQGSEDCLYLNVYRPAGAKDSAPLPVMVWFHGGGFVSGSGNAFYGAYLAQTANAIVVTVNYRLGPLGWLALPSLAAEAEDHSTGNYGLLDNIAALKWVKRNISAFGGDPGRVTIFGQSAGGEQVFVLLCSPLAAGLFHRAISMSAPAGLNLPTVAQIAPKRAGMLAKLGCSDEATQPARLRRLDAQQILDAVDEGWNLLKDAGLGWTPTVDGAVLPDQWVNLFRQGRFNRVPVMVGHTKEEGRPFVAIFENDAGEKMTKAQAVQIMQSFFGPKADAVMQKYELKTAPEPGGVCAKIVTDSLFATGEDNDREALAQFVPVFGYRSYDPNAPESHVHALYSKIGAGHDSDLAYLFQWDDFSGRQPEFTPEQQTLASEMGRYWGQFAASGEPNGDRLPRWSPTSAGQIQYLEPLSIGGVRSVPINNYIEEHKVEFWASLTSPHTSKDIRN